MPGARERVSSIVVMTKTKKAVIELIELNELDELDELLVTTL